MIETYQEEQERVRTAPEPPHLATVAEVLPGGLRLQFDGEETAGNKICKANAAVEWAEGMRTVVLKLSGTYVAVCPIKYDEEE